MELGSFLVFINLAIATLAGMLMVYIYPFRRWPEVRYLALLAASFLVVSFCTVNVLSQQHLVDKIFFSRMRFLGLSLMCPSYLLFLSHLSGRWNWLRKTPFTLGIFLVPAITIAFSLLPYTRDLLVYNFTSIEFSGMSVVRFDGGPWFPVHLLVAYGSVLLVIVLGLQIIWQKQNDLRFPVSILMITVVATSVIDQYAIFSGSMIRWQMIPTSFYGFNLAAIVYCLLYRGLGDISVIAKQNVFSALPDPVVISDRLGRIAGFNKAAQKKFGLSPNDLARSWNESLRGVPNQAGEYGFLHQGSNDVLDLSLSPLASADGQVRGTLFIYRDVTLQKKIESEMERIGTFNAELMSLIGHDLSGNLIGLARIIENVIERLPAEHRALALHLKESADANRDLIHGIVLWMRDLHPELKSEPRPYEANALIYETLESLEMQARLRQVQLKFTPTVKSLVLTGDSSLTGLILRNLLTNAIRASLPGQSVQIKLARTENEIQLQIQDFGSGMSQELLSSIIAQKGPLSAREEGGYGIGLRLTQKFLARVGARLDIHSRLGEGTTVSVAARAQDVVFDLQNDLFLSVPVKDERLKLNERLQIEESENDRDPRFGLGLERRHGAILFDHRESGRGDFRNDHSFL